MSELWMTFIFWQVLVYNSLGAMYNVCPLWNTSIIEGDKKIVFVIVLLCKQIVSKLFVLSKYFFLLKSPCNPLDI